MAASGVTPDVNTNGFTSSSKVTLELERGLERQLCPEEETGSRSHGK